MTGKVLVVVLCGTLSLYGMDYSEDNNNNNIPGLGHLYEAEKHPAFVSSWQIESFKTAYDQLKNNKFNEAGTFIEFNKAAVINKNFCGDTILHRAPDFGNNACKVAEFLIKNGGQVNEVNNALETPLHKATESGNLELVKLLLKDKANPHARTIDNKSVLHIASAKGNNDLIQLFVGLGVSVRAMSMLNDIPLHNASTVNGAKLLLFNGAENIFDFEKNSVLHTVCANGFEDVVKFLVEHGFDPMRTNIHNESCLEKAKHFKQKDVWGDGPADRIIKTLLLAPWWSKYKNQNISIENKETIIKELCNHASKLVKIGNTKKWYESCYDLNISWQTRKLLSKENDKERTEFVEKFITTQLSEKKIDKNASENSEEIEFKKEQEKLRKIWLDRKPTATETIILPIATGFGLLDVLESFTKKGVPLDVASLAGQTLLHVALDHEKKEKVNYNLVKFLIKQGISAEDCNVDGVTPFHLAAKLGDVKIFDLILEQNPSFILRDKEGKTVFNAALDGDNLEIIKKIHKKCPYLIHSKTYKNQPALHTAIESNCSPDVIQFILDQQLIDINEKADGKTAILQAVAQRNLEQIKILLKNKAAIDKDILLVMDYWSIDEYESAEIIELLYKHGADVNVATKREKWTPLHIAARWGWEKAVKKLIELGAAVDSLDGYQRTPLHKACQHGRGKAAKILLECGAVWDQKDRTIETIKQQYSSTSFYEWRVEEVEVQNRPFDYMVYKSNEDQPEFLDALLSKVKLSNDELKKLLVHVISKNKSEMMAVLLRHGIDPNLRLNLKDKPLGIRTCLPIHLAVVYNAKKITRLLAESGADVNSGLAETGFSKWINSMILPEEGSKNKNLHTPIELSFDPDIVKILLEHGAQVTPNAFKSLFELPSNWANKGSYMKRTHKAPLEKCYLLLVYAARDILAKHKAPLSQEETNNLCIKILDHLKKLLNKTAFLENFELLKKNYSSEKLSSTEANNQWVLLSELIDGFIDTDIRKKIFEHYIYEHFSQGELLESNQN